jgi:divalent metal cation (Fe/Co/Zn/Cd) transporter
MACLSKELDFMTTEDHSKTDPDANIPLIIAAIGGTVFFLTTMRQGSIGIPWAVLGALGAFLITFVIVWAGMKVYRALSKNDERAKRPFDQS